MLFMRLLSGENYDIYKASHFLNEKIYEPKNNITDAISDYKKASQYYKFGNALFMHKMICSIKCKTRYILRWTTQLIRAVELVIKHVKHIIRFVHFFRLGITFLRTQLLTEIDTLWWLDMWNIWYYFLSFFLSWNHIYYGHQFLRRWYLGLWNWFYLCACAIDNEIMTWRHTLYTR